ncbi:MAG: multifunctional CCA tRNA nucleotidyl transferase/2'3'-cyclic phosphodiesterase/2'nucleotidase/phosphatase, partial [Gammaproteobacteria bacterium]|nr:multifunctional CCA tRNA nucleotidyl transferase/2'3'-cyclic phosphodiesterase/2'nucleotidase/phosphatase [Gammaproteobacteria bacterium]NIR93953.1 multifunctional CCA tRNA nucleotidyl transferase/2'3'-cyclic phosphodiesterase/2'nucleotidase/phosphatase [Gammaproteobacteria bacterium]NIW45072.1 multifunctional CCA tRNA nucleotidyl transferase/2'3'-cyclic phosphodiesterase/2'nucleotidase/phosphatase [Gammaproteobacteria bacterium]
GTLLETLHHVDAFRRPERFELFITACEADSRGRPGYENRVLTQPDILRAALTAANSVQTKELVEQGYTGKAMAERLHELRCLA